MPRTYTLISAIAGDGAPGIDVGELEAADSGGLISLPDLARLTDLPEVHEFFATNHYDSDHPDEVMHLVEGELESGRWPTLTVTLPDESVDIINLTPHPVTIAGVTIPPAGPAPRCATTAQSAASVWFGDREIPVEIVGVGTVTGLPEPVAGTIIIVSRVVAEAAPNRRDLYIPHKLERDGQGRVTGCAALGQVPAGSEPVAESSTVEMPTLNWYALADAALAKLRGLAKERRARVSQGDFGQHVEDDNLDAEIYNLGAALNIMARAVMEQLDPTQSYPASYSHPGNWQAVLGQVPAPATVEGS